MLRIIRATLIGVIVFCLFSVFLCSCKKTPRVEKQQPELKIGYRASLPADVGPIWAYEAGAIDGLCQRAETLGFGPPHMLLQSLKQGSIDMVTVMPLEPVLEDIRKNEANYLIYCLLCFSSEEAFDAIVVAKPDGDIVPTWDNLSGGFLGVIPSTQNLLIGAEIIRSIGIKMQVKEYNPQSALLSLSNKEFAAIHVLGADVARAKTNPRKYLILEECPASNRVFGGKVVPAGVGLISKDWAMKYPDVAKALIDQTLEFSNRSHQKPYDQQLVNVLGKAKYGAFDSDTTSNLTFAPIISYENIEPENFKPLIDFLNSNNVDTPKIQSILDHIYKGR